MKATGDLHDGLYPSQDPLYLYYQVSKPLAGIPESIEVDHLVTEIDVVFGLGDRVAWGFEKPNRPVIYGKGGAKSIDPVWIVFRKGMTSMLIIW